MPMLKNTQIFAEDLLKEDLEIVERICREVFENAPQASLVYSAIAAKIRERLDKELNPKKGWCVVVGRSFGSFVTQKIKCYCYLSVYAGVNILVWKV